MTDRDRAAPEDHLRDAAQRQRRAPRAVRARPRAGARRARRHTTATSSAAASATATARSRSGLADRRLGHGHVRQGHPRRTSRTPSRPPARRSRPGRAGRGRSASRSCARVADSSASARWSSPRCSSIEVGKNRLEALGDVEETADLIRWSCDMVEQNDGFDHPMGNLGDAAVHTRSVLKPYGVWGVISPFNFPFALSGGPSGGALVAGNTVVYKPSAPTRRCSGVLPDPGRCATRASPTASSTWSWARARRSAPRSRRTTASTGSSSPARSRSASTSTRTSPGAIPKPVIVEMGGKNPAIVSRHADLDEAAEGDHARRLRLLAARSARPTAASTSSGRSTTSSLRRLVEKTEAITIGDPIERQNWLGPGHQQKARRRATSRPSARRAATAAAHRRRAGHRGRPRRAASSSRRPSSPTCRRDHRLFRDELFVPFTAVAAVDSIDEALDARRTTSVLGLTAGFYSEDEAEISNASSTRSRPASSTSTAAPARRPAPGRASSRSAAGRARPRPASPAAASTTSSSSCASSRQTIVD